MKISSFTAVYLMVSGIFLYGKYFKAGLNLYLYENVEELIIKLLFDVINYRLLLVI